MLPGVVQAQAFKAVVEAQLFPISPQDETGFPVDRTIAAGHQKIGHRRARVHQLALVLPDQEAQQRLVARRAVEPCLLHFAAQVGIVGPGERHRADRHGQGEWQQQLPLQAEKSGEAHG